MTKKLSISGKFLLSAAVVSTVLFTIITIMVVRAANQSHTAQSEDLIGLLRAEQKQEEKLLKESLLQKGKSLAALLAQIGAGFVIGYDFDTLQQIATSAAKDPDVAYVTFYDLKGKALTKESKKEFKGEVVKQAVTFEKKALGEVRIGLSFIWIDKNMEGISGRIEQKTKQTREASGEAVQSIALQIILFSAVAVVILCLSIYLCLTRCVLRPVKTISHGLGESAQKVALTSDGVNSTSQSLAQGASEQAASLQETTASMEEMASMTSQSAENAEQADGMMKQSAKVVDKANQSMGKLKQAMDKINAASDETAKIIKTIDEIAFQTNLLALNAAVEAARAGEAGAGFAVVADEVRNLAMRAAEAAKNTSTLIEENIKDIKTGSELVASTDEAFTQVQESAAKVGELVGEIAAASKEQAEGIQQVNKALGEMDRVTQQTAANTEETAASAEELAAQAGNMRGLVEDLMSLVGKAANRKEREALSNLENAGTRSAKIEYRPQKGKKKGISAPSEKKAEEAIPLGDEDFKDF